MSDANERWNLLELDVCGPVIGQTTVPPIKLVPALAKPFNAGLLGPNLHYAGRVTQRMGLRLQQWATAMVGFARVMGPQVDTQPVALDEMDFMVQASAAVLASLFATMGKLPPTPIKLAPVPVAQSLDLESLAAAAAENSDTIVAVGAEGMGGKAFNWGGQESRHYSMLAELADALKVRRPTTKDAAAYFGDACHAEQSSHRVVRKSRQNRGHYEIATRTDMAQVGEALAVNVAVVWLDTNGEVQCTVGSDVAVTERITARYLQRLTALEMKPGEITSWLHEVFSNDFDAIRTSIGWFIKNPEHHAAATQLCAYLMDDGWGKLRDWSIGVDVATTGGILDSMARNLEADIAAQQRNLCVQTIAAKNRAADKKLTTVGVTIGARMATTMIAAAVDVAAKTKAYAQIIGPQRVHKVYVAAQKLIAELQPLVSDAAQRAALIWDEIDTFGDAPSAE